MFNSIRTKIQFIVVCVLLSASALIMAYTWFTVKQDQRALHDQNSANVMQLALLDIQTEYEQLVDYRSMVIKLRKNHMRDEMNAVFQGLETLRSLGEKGLITLAQAKEAAKKQTTAVRFGNNEYFYIYDGNMTSLAHPDPKMPGRNIKGVEDEKGVDLGKTLEKIANENPEGGFLDTWWKRLDSPNPVPKLLYIKRFEPWNWYVGTGIYMDDVDSVTANERRDAVTSLRNAFHKLHLGESGRLFVFDTDKKLIIPPANAGPEFAELKNLDTGNSVLHDLKQIVRQNEKTLRYKVKSVDGQIHEKMSEVAFFQPLGWYVATTVDLDEVRKPLLALLLKQVGIALLVLITAIGVMWWALTRICRPLSSATAMATSIASGDISSARQAFSEYPDFLSRAALGENGRALSMDETGRLLTAFMTMTENLNSLVGKVQRAGATVTDQAVKILSAVHTLENSVDSQASSTMEVRATASEISSTSGELAQTMGEVAMVAAQTSTLAQSGMSNLEDMGQTITRLRKAAETVSSKLSAISDKAGGIGKVVTAISKVAEQTNLLSFNASIEAEKAGEFGQGFAVVAREIRKLADQTAISTLDIEKMVAQMQGAVSSGVMEMDKFGSEVERSAAEVESITDQMSSILDEVRTLEPSIASVDGGMQTQSVSAREISNAMDMLSGTVERTKSSIEEFSGASQLLSDAIQELEAEVARFHVDD